MRIANMWGTKSIDSGTIILGTRQEIILLYELTRDALNSPIGFARSESTNIAVTTEPEEDCAKVGECEIEEYG